MGNSTKLWVISVIILILLAGYQVFTRPGVSRAFEANRILSAVLTDQPYKAGLWGEQSDDCSSRWLLGALEKDGSEEQVTLWKTAVGCDPLYVDFLAVNFPESLELALYSIEVQPETGISWFWLSQFYTVSDPDRAIQLLKEGLQFDPGNGHRWNELGNLLFPVDKEKAIDAFLQACFNGDPGWNGCWRAGQTAEALGKNEVAVIYYRYSHWKNALQRADDLEKQLSGQDNSDQ